MERDERAVYVISVAAELAGVHPQTLRIYERKGLIEPQRTEGRSRRYSERDIALLRRIQELTNAGVSLAGVQKVLDLEQELSTAEARIDALLRRRPRKPWPASTGATAAPWCRCRRGRSCRSAGVPEQDRRARDRGSVRGMEKLTTPLSSWSTSAVRGTALTQR
jgi:DNA-binding transcriptional MerR regulator